MPPVRLKRINKPNISDTVIEQILDLFLSGKLKVGDRLPSEAELAEQVGVGRNSIREAMKVLQVLGIVERRQGDGSYISDTMPSHFETILLPLVKRIKTPQEMLDLREMVELGILELVINRATEEDFEKLEQIIQKQEQFLNMPKIPLEEAVKVDMSFHTSIIEITRNEALIQLGHIIMRIFQSSMGKHIETKEGLQQAIHAHRSILRALRSRSISATREEIVKSLEVWKDYIRIVNS
ncbi:MAG: FadR family transcriptional regulator [Spirochaetes bacterium]|nr:FadR family transcriptional regulator [Spirochaetota bacterium]